MKLSIKLALGFLAVCMALGLAWLWVLPSFAAAMKESGTVQLPVQLPAPATATADFTVLILAPNRYRIGDRELDQAGLRALLAARPSPPSVWLSAGNSTDFKEMTVVLDLLRTSGVEKVAIVTQPHAE